MLKKAIHCSYFNCALPSHFFPSMNQNSLFLVTLNIDYFQFTITFWTLSLSRVQCKLVLARIFRSSHNLLNNSTVERMLLNKMN